MENQPQNHIISFEKDGMQFQFVTPREVTYGQAIDAAVLLISGLADLARKAVTEKISKGDVIDASAEQS